MKKFFPYCILSLIFLAISIILSVIFDFSLSNTWQALVALPFIFGPIWILGWKQVAIHKTKHPLLCVFGRFCLVVSAIGYMITVVFFCVGLI